MSQITRQQRPYMAATSFASSSSTSSSVPRHPSRRETRPAYVSFSFLCALWHRFLPGHASASPPADPQRPTQHGLFASPVTRCSDHQPVLNPGTPIRGLRLFVVPSSALHLLGLSLTTILIPGTASSVQDVRSRNHHHSVSPPPPVSVNPCLFHCRNVAIACLKQSNNALSPRPLFPAPADLAPNTHYPIDCISPLQTFPCIVVFRFILICSRCVRTVADCRPLGVCSQQLPGNTNQTRQRHEARPIEVIWRD